MRSKAGGKARDPGDSDRLQATRPDAGFDSEDDEGTDDDLERAGRDDEGVFDQEDSDEAGDQAEDGEQDKERLARTKLTQRDYAKRAHSAKAKKKGKYGVTVPRPFSGMMDKPKAKTIA